MSTTATASSTTSTKTSTKTAKADEVADHNPLFDDAQDQGYFGTLPDQRPEDEDLTLAGVTKGS